MTDSKTTHRHNVPAARDLRTRQTRAETVLWRALRNRQLAGLKFRRQHPISTFVVDFCCPDRRLAIEVDGDVHASQQEHDAEREELLALAGYRMLRFRNDAVLTNLPSVLSAISAAAKEYQPEHPAPRGRLGAL